jgi:nucleotide-binding universal stress UspA family protein
LVLLNCKTDAYHSTIKKNHVGLLEKLATLSTLRKMKKILFPTDFSENAAKAMQYALLLTKELHADLILLNTYQVPAGGNTSIKSMHLIEILKSDSEEGLQKVLNEIRAQKDFDAINIETVAKQGDLVQLINEMSAEFKFDLVVMGTKGATGAKEVLVGSNTAAVVKRAACPVLVIPEKANYKKPQKFTFAYDLKPIKEISWFNLFKTLVKQLNAEIAILNVGLEEVPASTDEAVAGIKLNHLLEGVNHNFYFVKNENVSEGIENYIKEKGTDCLVMIARKHSFLEKKFHKSITKKMAYHVDVPLLVLKEY